MHQEILQKLSIDSLNPMQEEVLPSVRRADTVVLSPTGSGKTLAFLLAVYERFTDAAGVQAVVLVPTRELALQIEGVFKSMGTGNKVTCCYGGHSVRTEKNLLLEAPALLVGTPGRIAHHLEIGSFDPGTIHTLVLDEFDKSLEMGFHQDMSFILGRMASLRRRILTSATPLDHVPAFVELSDDARMVNYLQDEDALPELTLKTVSTSSVAKLDTLFSLICAIGSERMLVFCNHRDAVDRISELLATYGLVHETFHGGLEQPDRERALLKFRNGTSRILLVTDLASRGLDIPEVSAIVHYQMPLTEEAFIHRNGRTARMHATGTVYLLLDETDKVPYLAQLPARMDLPPYDRLPPETEWETLYFSAGKKEKISKTDIVGVLLKKGGLQKDEVGLIEIKDDAAFAAVKREEADRAVRRLRSEKLKGKRVKVDIAR